MSRKFLNHYILAASLAVAACGEEDDGDESPTDGAVPGADAATADAAAADAGTGACDGLTYDNYAKGLMVSGGCTACHGATPAGNTVKLDTLANVKTNKADILTHAIEPRQEPKMPQGLPALPMADQAKLKKWLECGAP